MQPDRATKNDLWRTDPYGLVLGIMSGTSIDSVDYALCSVNARGVGLRHRWQVKFPAALRARLHRAAQGQATSHEVGQLHHDLGRFYARAARHGLGAERPQAVGLHGQTIFHHPDPATPATFQLGEPAWLVEELGVPVVSNFRAGDLAAGGQGAPLATLFHQIVFGQRGRFVCVNNLGGISNVTAIDWRLDANPDPAPATPPRGATRKRPNHKTPAPAPEPRILAFDTGPANVLLDLAMRHFTAGRQHLDRSGAWAARGRAFEPLLERWLAHEYFLLAPPKSTGRELFGEPFWARVFPSIQSARLSPQDVLTTLTEYTARSLTLNYRLHLGGLPNRVILSGGGAANRELVRRIRANLAAWHPPIEVLTSEQLGWPIQSLEPAAFALLAWRRLHRLPGNLPATTGARRAALLGQISEP